MSEQNQKSSGGFNPIGLCIGAGIGLCFGVAMDNLALGLCLGLGVGLCYGVALGHRTGTDEKPDDKPKEDK